MMPPFDDSELERYFQRIEARTERRARRLGARRRAVPPVDKQPESCPTPGKTGHPSEDDAWLAVAVLRAGRLRTPDLDVYLCRCGLWHITSG